MKKTESEILEPRNSVGSGGKHLKKPTTFLRIPHRKPIVVATQLQKDLRMGKPVETHTTKTCPQEEHLYCKQRDTGSKNEPVQTHTPTADTGDIPNPPSMAKVAHLREPISKRPQSGAMF